MTDVYTKKQRYYIQSFMQTANGLLVKLLGPEAPDEPASMQTRIDQLSLMLDTMSAGAAIAGIVLAPPTLGVALVGAGAGVVFLQVLNGAVHQIQHVISSSLVRDELNWEDQCITWCITLREVAEGLARRYRQAIEQRIDEHSIGAFARVGAERVMKRFKERLGSNLPLEPHDLMDYLMSSATLSLTHATERLAFQPQWVSTSLLAPQSVYAKWVYARSRMMLYRKTAPFTVEYGFYSSLKERLYLQTDTTVSQYGYVCASSHAVLDAEITQSDRQLIALPNPEAIAMDVHDLMCIDYPVSLDETLVYLNDVRTLVQNGDVCLSFNDYLSGRLKWRAIANLSQLMFEGLDLSFGDFSDVNARGIHIKNCNLQHTNWRGAHLERAFFQANDHRHASYQSIFGAQSQWIDEQLYGDYSQANMQGVLFQRCTIHVEMQDRGCNWERATLDNVQVTTDVETLFQQSAVMQQALTELTQQVDWVEDQLHRIRMHEESVTKRLDTLQQDVESLKNQPFNDLQMRISTYLETLFEDAILPFYVDLSLVSSGYCNTASWLLWDRLDAFLDNPDEHFFLLHGDIGSGKSLSMLRFTQQLAQQHQTPHDWLPIYVKLQRVDDNTREHFLDAALKTVFNPEEIGLLKATYRCVIILDGLDECGVHLSSRPVVEECANRASEWSKGTPKIVLTTQTRCLIDSNYHRMLRISPDVDFPRESEYAIEPLNSAQIESCLRFYCPTGVSLNAWEALSLEIQALARSPLMMHIICAVLRSAESNAHLLTSRAAFYDAFMHHWSQQVTSKRTQFTADSIKKYCGRVAFWMFVEKQSYIDRPYEEEREPLQQDDERRLAVSSLSEPFAYLFESDLWKTAGWLAPMSAVLIKQGDFLWQVRHTFLHPSFQARSLAHALIEKITDGSPAQRLVDWNHAVLNQWPDVFYFLSELVRTHPYREGMIAALRDMVSASAGPDGERWCCAASNAMTLLNALQIDFCTLVSANEWRGIRIPYANLRGCRLAFVDLSGSDLSHVVFDNHAILAECNLTGATLTQARFSDALLFGVMERPSPFFAVLPSDTWVVTYVAPTSDYLSYPRSSRCVSVGLNDAVYPCLLGHQDDVYVGVWGAAAGQWRFASAGAGQTIRVQAIADDGLSSKEIAKLHDRPYGVIRQLSWSKEGHILAVAGDGAFVRLWNVDKKERMLVTDYHARPILAVVLGQLTSVMLSVDSAGIVRLWSLRVQDRVLISTTAAVKKKCEARPFALALSSTEEAFVVGSDNGELHVYPTNYESFERITSPTMRLKGHYGRVNSVIWNARHLVSAGMDGSIRVWDAARAACVSMIKANGLPVQQVAWMPGGRHVLAGGGVDHRLLFLVDTETRTSYSAQQQDGVLYRLTTIAPYQTYLASGSLDGSVWIWDVKDSNTQTDRRSARLLLPEDDRCVLQVAWSEQGQYLASRHQNGVRVCEMAWPSLLPVSHPDGWGDITLAQDGSVLIHHMTWLNDRESKEPWLVLAGSDGCIYLWKIEHEVWILTQTIRWSNGALNRFNAVCVAAAPNRRSILEASVLMTDVPNNTPISRRMTRTSSLKDMVPSDWPASPMIHRNAEVSDPSSGEISTSAGSNDATNQLAVSIGTRIDVWDYHSHESSFCIAKTLTGHHYQPIKQLAWSCDGRFLASLDEAQTVCVWNTLSWQCVFEDNCILDKKHMTWLMMAGDEQWLVLGSSDSLRIFNASFDWFETTPTKRLDCGSDQSASHAGILFLVRNRSIDMVSLAPLLSENSTDVSWLGRIGEGLCMQGCIATNAEGLSPATQTLIRHLGAVVSRPRAAGTRFNFWQSPPAQTVPFPAVSSNRGLEQTAHTNTPSLGNF